MGWDGMGCIFGKGEGGKGGRGEVWKFGEVVGSLTHPLTYSITFVGGCDVCGICGINLHHFLFPLLSI